jgi:hypothetical protein
MGQTIKDNWFGAIVLTGVIIVMIWAFMGAMSKSIDNQSVMLCKSALKSGNEEWSIKCVDYYKSGNPKDIK